MDVRRPSVIEGVGFTTTSRLASFNTGATSRTNASIVCVVVYTHKPQCQSQAALLVFGQSLAKSDYYYVNIEPLFPKSCGVRARSFTYTFIYLIHECIINYITTVTGLFIEERLYVRHNSSSRHPKRSKLFFFPLTSLAVVVIYPFSRFLHRQAYKIMTFSRFHKHY